MNKSKIKYSDIINFYLNKDYKLRSDILIRLSNHTDKLYENYIITTDERKKVTSLISDVINKLNMYYNSILLQLYPENIKKENDNDNEYEINNNDFITEDILEYDKIINNIDNDRFNYFIETIDQIRKNNIIETFYNGLKLANFNIIDNLLKKISNFIGLSNIHDILTLYMINEEEIKLDLDDKNKYDILKKIYIPISCNYIINKRIDKKNIGFEFLEKKNGDDKYSFLLGNLYQLKIRLNKNKMILEITGYIEIDSLNSIIRTSQICSNYVYEKKKIIMNELEMIKDIDKNFKLSYPKNLSLGDLLILDNININKKIMDDYKLFIKYTNMIFKAIMNDFIHSDVITKFNIIKFLLMGSSTSINIAALLFGITKDNKESIDNNSKPTLLSDLIYKNLKFISQSKLKKSDTILLQELEKINSLSNNDIDLKKQILSNKSMPDYVKKIALSKLDEIKSGNSSESYKHMDYVKTLIDYPWISSDYTDIFSILNSNINDAKEFIDNAKLKMNQIIYGHDKCKETIIELIAKWISNPKSIGKCIGLKGPPGVGKTLFGKTLGNILNIPFAQINVGGIDDASILSGHSFTYSNAQPGLIVRKMTQAGAPRCIIFIDEIDKTGIKYGINEIMNVLIHITDPNTNDNFNDKFFQEVTFPLNKVLFIFSYNDQSKVDKILLDRIEQINVDSYTSFEKIQIFKNFILKEVCDEINIDKSIIEINDDIIEYLIETFTYESGVRNLKRKIEKILLKLNLDKIYSQGIFKNNIDKINISVQLIDDILDKTNINIKKVLPKSYVGIINGLYATDSGIGGILPILIYKKCNGSKKFKLKLTGSQKSVMQESIEFSFTLATNLVKNDYVNKFIEDNPDGLHIHTPDGATPKDGPSAGAAFTTAFISKILNMPIKNNIAMTGEIETNGLVTAIGGLESKLQGAKKAGVELVFVPNENKSDYEKIIKKNNKLICDNFNVKLVSHISEILEYVLIDNKTKYKIDEKTIDCKKYLNVF
jgi:endopeptidase La